MNKITAEKLDEAIAQATKTFSEVKIILHARLYWHLRLDPNFKKDYEFLGYEKIDGKSVQFHTYKGIRLFVDIAEYLIGDGIFYGLIVPTDAPDDGQIRVNYVKIMTPNE